MKPLRNRKAEQWRIYLEKNSVKESRGQPKNGALKQAIDK